MNSAVLNAISQIEASKQEDHMIRRLGQALIQTFHIRPGQELALLLAKAPARNNEEAVYQWVRERLSRPSQALAESALPHLVSALEYRLHELEELTW